MNLELEGKKVLITGASRGIGASIAYRFLEEGSDVIIVSRGSDALFTTEKKLQNEFGKYKVIAEKCDCTDQASIDNLKNKITSSVGSLDILVNNVGDGQSVSDVLPNKIQWTKTWENNFNSSLQITRAFLPLLRESKGSLLFISSIAAIEAFGAPVDYSTAKSAILALAKNMARKLAKEVRVNVLAPGNIYFKGGAWDTKIIENKLMVDELIKSSVPMNRFGTPEEVADAAVFLCSDRAKFITGATLVVDGGQTVSVM
jgi:3-oxoacyl-[acyl-carrier protein] reductase